ncbi:MAG: hypothetical protein M3120_03690 [Pseudomonadota bacterium]|nr:hypothetical protein [Pseudomonadota bacterium]
MSDGARGIVCEVNVGLMMELEGRIRLPSSRIMPPAGVPGPRDSSLAQAVANRREPLRGHPVTRWGPGLVGRVERLDVIHHVPIRRDIAIARQPDQGAVAGELGLGDEVVRSLWPDRCAGADQPEVVEHRPAESRGEEVICQGVGAGVGIERKQRRVVIAHGERAGVGPGDVPIHPAAVELKLVLVEPMDRRGYLLVEGHVPVDRERGIGQVGREASVERRRLVRRRGINHRRQSLVKRSIAACLTYLRTGLGEPVRAGEQAIEVIKRMVLLVDHNQVLDRISGRVRSRGGRTGPEEEEAERKESEAG